MNDKNNALGRNLDSLFAEAQSAETPVQGSETGFRQMDVADILVPPGAAKVTDAEIPPLLIDSVRDYGILQPLLVRKSPQGYTLIDGRKRLAAANRCKLKSVPVMVMRVSPEDADSVRTAANWRPSARSAVAATSFAHLDEDDTRRPSRGHIKWVYVVTGAVLLLFLAGEAYVRYRQAPRPEPARDGREPAATDNRQAPPETEQPEDARPRLAGDLTPPRNPQPLPLPPPEDRTTGTSDDASVDNRDTQPPTGPLGQTNQVASVAVDTDESATTPPEDAAGASAATSASAEPPADQATPVALAITGDAIETRPADAGIHIVFRRPIFRFRTVMHDWANGDLADVAAQLEPVASELEITVVGHTDNDPMPPNARYADNRELGLARAKAAAQSLTTQCGLPAANVKTTSWGESNPPYSNNIYDSRVKNRTVSLLIAPQRAAP